MTDISGLNELVADLSAAPAEVQAKSRAVVQKGANNVKEDARRLISGLAHAPAYPASISYDTDFVRGGWEGRVGPDKSKPQGALGNLLEYGSANNAPLAHLGPALDVEGPKFEQAMAQLVEGIL